VRKLLDRLKAASRPAPLAADSEEGFFSTMFVDHSDDTRQAVNWPVRSVDVRAEPFDRAQGIRLFSQLWGEDRQAVALDAQDLERLGGFLDFVKLPPGQEVISQDEQGDYMLIVLDGTLAVDRIQPWGGRARLAEARAGDMLGEMSLLDAGARFSACTTLTPCLAAVLDAHRLDQMIRNEPKLALALLASLSRRLSLRLRQVSARLSALLSRS
jgi:CRP/FNR family cyclic AMP-dependent transcriptional regulator